MGEREEQEKDKTRKGKILQVRMVKKWTPVKNWVRWEGRTARRRARRRPCACCGARLPALDRDRARGYRAISHHSPSASWPWAWPKWVVCAPSCLLWHWIDNRRRDRVRAGRGSSTTASRVSRNSSAASTARTSRAEAHPKDFDPPL